jgi:hypothetical protein
MQSKNTELSFEPVSTGNCEAQHCLNPAKYRATWSQGIVLKLVCTTHRSQVEGKYFNEVGPSIFGSAPPAR